MGVKRVGARKRNRRGQWFQIIGYTPCADGALCAMARGKRDAVRKISFLLENHPKVTFVEILRYRSQWQSEQEIRDAVSRKPVANAPPKLGPDGCLLH